MYISLLFIYFIVAVVQLLTGVWLFETPWTLGFLVLHYLLEFAQTHIHCVHNTSQPSYPLSPFLLLPSLFPSIRVFLKWVSSLHWWPRYWSFSFSNPSEEYTGLISFRVDWFDLLAVWGILKHLLQHHNSKTILWHSAFFMVQLSGEKNITLIIQTFIRKVISLLFLNYYYYFLFVVDFVIHWNETAMGLHVFPILIPLLFNRLSRFVIAFLPRSKHLLISWLKSISAVILESKKIKSSTVSTFSPSISVKQWDQMAWS